MDSEEIINISLHPSPSGDSTAPQGGRRGSRYKVWLQNNKQIMSIIISLRNVRLRGT